MNMSNMSMNNMNSNMGMNMTNLGVNVTNGMSMGNNSMNIGNNSLNMNNSMDMGNGMGGMDMGGGKMDMGMGGMDMGSGKLDMNMGMHMMSMYFSMDLPVYILFYQWKVTTQAQLAAACVGSFLLSMLYEGLKAFREFIVIRKQISSKGRSKIWYFCNGWHFLQSILQIIQTTIGMFLMLIYMTFHIWLAVAVSLGAGVGYFLFSWGRVNINEGSDHCS